MSTSSKKLANILIGEDNPGDLLLIETHMQRANVHFHMHTAKNGVLIIDLLTKAVEPNSGVSLPDIIFLDLNMPKKNGMAVLEFILNHKQLQSIPVCMLSGSDSQAEINQALEAGAKHFIEKPLDYEKLQKVVNSLDCLTLEQEGDQLSLYSAA